MHVNDHNQNVKHDGGCNYFVIFMVSEDIKPTMLSK